jgi:hypothetical protein
MLRGWMDWTRGNFQYRDVLSHSVTVYRMFLAGFRGFSCKHGRIPNGALERSLNKNLFGIRHVGTTWHLQTNFHAFSIPFRCPECGRPMWSSPLIQISLLRRNNNVFASAINNPFDLMSCYSTNRGLSRSCASNSTTMTMARMLRPCLTTHQARMPFYITPCRQKNPASVENYAFELHQVMILRLSRVGRTSCSQMVGHGRVHFIIFQNIIPLCMKN